MTNRHHTRITAWLAGFGMLAIACGGGQAAAEAALTAVENSYAAIRDDAAEYLPEQAKNIEATIADARATVENGDYAQARSLVQDLVPTVSGLGAAIAAKKSELTEAWQGLGASLPGAVSAIQDRLASLGENRRLPAGLTEEAVEGAKAGLESINSQWTEAGHMFESGKVASAVSMAQTVKARVVEVMTSLGMTVPEALR